jgi:hypothetical protein
MPQYQISTRKWLQTLQLQSSNGFHTSTRKTLGRSSYGNASLDQRKVTKYSKQTCQVPEQYESKSSYELHSAQRDLYRAGSILQQIFDACREKLFNHPIEKIEYEKRDKKKSEIMNLHFLPAEKFGPPLDDRLFRFPARQCKTLADEKALLSYDSCTAVNIYMKEVAEYLLRGEL